MGVSEYRRIGVCKRYQFCGGVLGRCRGSQGDLSPPGAEPPTRFRLGLFWSWERSSCSAACSSTDSAKKDDPVFFGQAGGRERSAAAR